MSQGDPPNASLNVTNEGMLIPENIADAPTQRFYVTSLFVFLQALKFYDYIQLYGATTTAETIFAVKWIGIDAAFLFLVPKLKIPWLSFRITTSFMQLAVASVLNICLSARIPISASAIGCALLRMVYDRELSVLEHNVKVSNIINNSSRILGRHTVNILPESTAKLNPSGSCFCVDSFRQSSITIPVRLNSTIPMHLQYSRIDPASNEVFQYNITGKQLKTLVRQADHNDKVWELSLPITKAGLYRLERVQDTSKLDVRLYRSQALVVECPSATLVIPERLKTNPDRCTGDLDELSIRASGLPPLRVKYNRWIEGRERVSTIDSVKPAEYTSPLMMGHHEQTLDQSVQQAQSLVGVQDLLWARPRQVDVHLNASLSTAGTWSYTIEEVEDACGNVVNFAKSTLRSQIRLPSYKAELEAPNVEAARSTEAATYHFHVHERPKISFRGCNSQSPTRLLENSDAKIHFDITSVEPGPFAVKIGRGLSDSLVPNANQEQDFYSDITLKTKHQTLVVNEPGLYNIKGFSSKHCQGIIEMPSSCMVVTPPQPSLSVAFEPIQDKCAG